MSFFRYLLSIVSIVMMIPSLLSATEHASIDTNNSAYCLTDLEAETTDSEVKLIWAHSGAFRYDVYRSDDEGVSFSLLSQISSTDPSYLDSAVSVNASYQYVVTEVDDSGVAQCESPVLYLTPSLRINNKPPAFITTPPIEAITGQPYQYDADTVDLQGDEIHYSLTVSSPGMTIDSETGLVNWTPQPDQLGVYTITIRAVDDGGMYDQQGYSLSVTEGTALNHAPQIISTPIETGEENQNYEYDVEATDADAGDILTYELTSAPSDMVMDSTTGLVSWQPLSGSAGEHTVTVHVVDQGGLSATQSYTLTIAQQSLAPQIVSTPPLSGIENQAYQYDVEATDGNAGDVLSYQLTSAPVGMTIDSATGLIDWLPSMGSAGQHDVTVQVEDQTGLTAQQSFSLTIVMANLPPSVTSTPVTSATETQAYQYDVESSDPNPGDSLSFSLVTAPAGMSIDSASGMVSWVPGETDIGTAQVTLRVVDQSGAEATQTYSIEVAYFNDPPTITSTAITTASEGEDYQYDVEAADPDAGDTLTYALATAPQGMTIDSLSGLIQWRPENQQIGDHPIEVQVTDAGGLSDSQAFTITVAGLNSPPNITSTPVITAVEASVYNYDVEAVDADGDPITYRLISAPTGMSIDAQSGLLSWTPGSADSIGNLSQNDYCRLSASSEQQRPSAMDAVMVVDGSASNQDTWPWVASAMASLNADLKMIGVGAASEQNRFGLVGFGTTPESKLFDGNLFGTIADLYEVTYDGMSPGGSGSSENGLRALQFTIDNYQFRDDVVKNLIWIPDERQQGTLPNDETLEAFTQRLIDGHYNVNVVTSFTIYCMDGRRAMGLDADGQGYVSDGNGGFDYCEIDRTPIDPATGTNLQSFIEPFVLPALATGGAAWSLSSITVYNEADSLRSAMTSRMFRTSTVNEAERGLADLAVQGIELIDSTSDTVDVNVSLINRGRRDVDSPVSVNLIDAGNGDQVIATDTLSTIAAGEVHLVNFVLDRTSMPTDIGVHIDADPAIECLTDNNRTDVPTVVVEAADDQGNRDMQMFAVTVEDLNQAPVINATPELLAYLGQPYRYQVTFDDPDLGDDHQFTLTSTTLAAIDQDTGLLTYTPAADDIGEQSFTVTITDLASASDTQTFNLNVSGDYLPPRFDGPPASSHATISQPYRFTPSVTADPTAMLTFSLMEGPAGMTIDAGDGSIHWVPDEADLNRLRLVTMVVTDQFNNKDALSFMLFGDTENQSPVITTLPGEMARLSQAYNYTLRYEDANIREDFELQLDTTAPNLAATLNQTYGVDNLYSIIRWRRNAVNGSYPRHLRDSDYLCKSPTDNHPSAALSSTARWSAHATSVGSHILAVPLTDSNSDGVIDSHDRSAILMTYAGGVSTFLRAYDLLSGEALWTHEFNGQNVRVSRNHVPAIADINSDGVPDILLVENSSRLLIAISSDDRRELWRSSVPISDSRSARSQITLTDLEGDGTPEILAGFSLYDAQGNWLRSFQPPATPHASHLLSPIYPLDLDMDGSKELVQGGVIHSMGGSELWHVTFSDNHSAQLAYSAFANFDADPEPEMVYVERSDADATVATVSLLDNDGSFIWGPNNLQYIGQPIVGDLNGDGELEIFVPGEDVMLDHQGIEQWRFSGNRHDGYTATAADLQGNGRVEILLNRSGSTRVLDALTGHEMAYVTTNTPYPYGKPLVADMDGDGRFEVASAGSRSVDLASITRDSNSANRPSLIYQNWWQPQGLNEQLAVNSNMPTPWSNGNSDQVVLPSATGFTAGLPDIWVDAPQGNPRQSVNVQVANRGTADYQGALEVELFAGDPLNGGELLGSQSLPGLAINESQTLQFTDLVPEDFVGELVARAVPESGLVECQTNNNITSAYTTDLLLSDHAGASDSQHYLLGVEYNFTSNSFVPQPIPEAIEGELFEIDLDLLIRSYNDDNNTAFFRVYSGPAGLSVDPDTGVVRWTPPYGSAGTHDASIYAEYLSGGSRSRFLRINVTPASNYPPEITSVPQTSVFAFQPFSYDVEATDPDGDTLSYSLTQSPSGMSIDANSGLIQWTPTADQVGSHNIEVSATDTEGLSATQSYTLTVTTGAANSAPEIISAPVANAIFDQAYSYDVEAVDSDNDPLSYSLTASPTGMAIDSATGVITWTPQSSQAGTHSVEVRVEDGRGGYAIQSFGLVVSDGSTTNSLPEIQSQPGQNARNNQNYTYQILASDADGDSLIYTLIQGPADMSLSTTGQLAWTPTSVETVSVRIRVSDDQGYVEQVWTLQVLDAADNLSATLSIQPASVAEGETVTLQVIVQNAIDPLSTTLTVDGDPVTLDSNHSAQLTASGIGAHAVVATVTDQYETVTENGSFQVTDPNSSANPAVTLIGPVDGSEITAPTEIVATIEDDDLSVWELWLIPPSLETIDLSQATLLASDTNTMNSQVIAEFDPTLLMNGQHRLYLRAIDAGGNEGYDFSVVQVTGDMKLGHFSITFKDLEVPLAGIPITITRTYDTRRRNESLDFGQGWSVGYQDMFVRESRPAGFNWFLDSYQSGPLGVLTTYCVRPYQDNIVTVTRPDGEVERFRAKATPECNETVPFLDVEIIFEALDGTDSTLEALDYNGGRLVNQHLVDPSMPGTPIDISRYRLTTREGVIYDLEQGAGIRTLTVPSGETLTFGYDGITHSNGAAVSFVRNADGRIERIEAPDGNQLHYSYNPAGDLISFTDQAAATSTYAYINDHYLQDIFDARGERAIRNLYDSEGRLIGQVDAEGNQIDYAYDLTGRSQTVTDRRGNDRILVFNDRGDILAETNALGETHQRTYNAYGDELSHTDPLGNVTVSTYDDHGNQLTETDPLGRTTTNTYSRYNQLESETAPDGRVTGFGYRNYILVGGVQIDKKGPLVSMTDGLNQTTGIGYDTSGYLPLSMTDAEGNITRYGYDSQGRMNRETAPDGSVTEYSHDAMGRVLTETRTRTDNGATLTEVTRHDYDAAGRRISTTDPLGNTTRTEYDEAGQVTAEIDALGNRTEYRYDARGNQTETHYPDGSSELRGYDPENNLIAQTNRAGQTTQMVYDAANRLIETIHPDATPNDDSDNPRSRNEYDAAGRLVAEIDPLGNRTEHAYNEVGQRISTTDALGNITRFEYDVHGNRTAMIDALDRRTEYRFDAADRMVEVSYADSSTTQSGYDAVGRRTSETDQGTISTQYAYDGQGRLTQVTDALGGATRYSYDEQGNKLTQTDARGRTTSWRYDSAGRVLSRTLPLGQQEQFVYDANGNLTRHTDFNGDTRVHQYDNHNRLIQSDYADGRVEVTSYDAQGNRSQIEVTHPDNSQETTLYSYDHNNRLESEVQPDGTVLSYQYDAAGNRTQLQISLTDGSSRTTDYAYDSLNRLERVTDAAGATTYGYDAVGNRTSVSYPNGSSEVYQYDSLNRLSRKETYDGTGALIQSYDYTLHATGRRTGIEELNGRTTRYGYDDLYRLTSESISDSQNGDYNASYQYDAVGNRSYSTVNGVQTAYTYDDNDRLTQQGGTRYTYDNNGNTLTETIDTDTTHYGYNAKNELVSVEQGGNTTEYSYNPNGIRTSKSEGGTTTRYLVDENRDYAQVVVEQDGTNSIDYTYGDDLISQSRNGVASYYHYDGLGSTRSLTDNLGNLANTYDYEAFGEVLNQTGTVENGYLFAGEQFDPTLDQYYLRARYYDQSQGRFTQQDTWMGNNSDPITLHKYLYANADPANTTDPSGQFGLVSLGVANNIRMTLTNLQTEVGMNILGAALDPDSVAEGPNFQLLGLSAIGGASAFKILRLLSSKFRKACNSFSGDTLVSTENGLKPISEIEIGEKVWAFNEETDEVALQEVVHLIQGEGDKEIVDITLETGEVIRATSGHPFYVKEDVWGWMDAGQLDVGDILRDAKGVNVTVASVKEALINASVYNLTIDNAHTYFVGEGGVLSHNSGKCKVITAVGYSKTISRQKQARHIKGTPEWNRKRGGYFNSESDAQEVLDAVHSGSAVILGKKKNGDLLVQYKGVQGFNNNPGAGFVDQATDKFFIKKGSPTSVVPTAPNKVPDVIWDE